MLYTADGIPIAKSHHYYTYREAPEAFAQKFLEETQEVEGPWFAVIYGSEGHGTPHRFYELARRLPEDRYKVVALDEFFAAARSARSEVEGRVLKPGKGIIKGVAP
jgi:pantothenate kinase-related protein Tda10